MNSWAISVVGVVGQRQAVRAAGRQIGDMRGQAGELESISIRL